MPELDNEDRRLIDLGIRFKYVNPWFDRQAGFIFKNFLTRYQVINGIGGSSHRVYRYFPRDKVLGMLDYVARHSDQDLTYFYGNQTYAYKSSQSKKDPMTTPKTTPSVNQVNMEYICRRKLDDLLFSTTAEFGIQDMQRVLLTRLGLRPHDSSDKYHLAQKEQLELFLTSLELCGFKYYSMDQDRVITMSLFDEDKSVFSCYVRVEKKPDSFGYHKAEVGGVHNHPAVAEVIKWLKANSPNPEFYETITCTQTSDGRLNTSESVHEVNKQRLAIDAFYPYFTRSIDEICERFLASSSPVMILLGPPGCGKSTFMRTLASKIKGKVYLTYDVEAASNSAFFSSYYDDAASKLCVTEDMDTLLESRSRGNKFMSTLLNVTEGFVQRPDKKIILSTNLTTNSSIDPALMRTGRCFDLLNFRELTPQEASSLSDTMNMQARQWDKKKSWSLSDVLNPEQESIDQSSQDARKPKAIGF